MSRWNRQWARGLAAPLVAIAAAALPALAVGASGTPATNQSSDVGPGYGPGYGMGPARMGGYGPGMMGGFGPDGCRMGPCAAGRYGAWGVHPRLSDSQRSQIEGVEKGLWSRQRPLMQSMQKIMFESWAPGAGRSLDVDATMKRATALSKLRLQMLRNRLEAARQIDAVLTPQQRESLDEAD